MWRKLSDWRVVANVTCIKAKLWQVMHARSYLQSEYYTKCLRIRSHSHIFHILRSSVRNGTGIGCPLAVSKMSCFKGCPFHARIRGNSVESQAAVCTMGSGAGTGTGRGTFSSPFCPGRICCPPRLLPSWLASLSETERLQGVKLTTDLYQVKRVGVCGVLFYPHTPSWLLCSLLISPCLSRCPSVCRRLSYVAAFNEQILTNLGIVSSLLKCIE